MKFKVSKGLNIPISGNINPDKKNSVSVRNVALLGEDYHGLKPTMLVKEGNVVIKGQNLFEDKKNPGVKFTSPVSGKIVEINRGERRSFLSMVIEKNLNSEIPIILMGYYNVIYHFGVKNFVKNCVSHGVDGLIIVDLQPEEDEELNIALKKNDIDFYLICLLDHHYNDAKILVYLALQV